MYNFPFRLSLFSIFGNHRGAEAFAEKICHTEWAQKGREKQGPTENLLYSLLPLIFRPTPSFNLY